MRLSLPILLVIGVAVLAAACAPQPALVMMPGTDKPVPPGESYDPPGSTITTGREIHDQVRRTLTDPETGVSVTNEYAGARLSDFSRVEDSLYRAVIRPENAPVNNSAWYGFKIWAEEAQSVVVELTYEDGDHRYVPKLSRDGANWMRIADRDFVHDTTNATARLRLDIGPEPLWISGQELTTSAWFDAWTQALARRDGVDRREVGRSRRDRPVQMVSFGGTDGTDGIVLIISRQHPPEVTGTLGMRRFVETLLEDSDLARAFRAQYRTLVIPIVNPDGADEGHWRHNAAGVDLNRDWLYFNQPEVRIVRDTFLAEVEQIGAPVVFAMDFHSTQEDIFYTHTPDFETTRPGLIGRWLEEIGANVPGYEIVEEAGGLDSPVSKNWFYTAFGTTAVTYEVGDEQDRELLDRIATEGARGLMRLLVDGGDD